ncbi:MBL fold metallo-hydrolase [Facklamia miroungae]|uniref:Ribonuclease J n=1 Tax=Facklamia miroungae TaxID=120956 RepID=A0A1G7V2X5_9LACT|nr:MBL fold metallo-hydrolase [Facklamia miroungae]NKZ30235.1 MBL fold metallo-hydrolase [Facklamia miroungae]SDG54077.1 ribonuclease J [Facklamia miroungae]
MSQTEIQFLGGLDTIGGNIISLQKDNHQILMDFGALVGADINQLLDRSLTENYLGTGLLPKAEGVYPSSQLGETSLSSFEQSPLKTVICLSHLHLDHLGSLGQISKQIPVYTSKDSLTFYKNLIEQSFLPKYDVDWHGVPFQESIQHGPFTIIFKESDHDTEGASAIFIESGDIKIVYSGDLRLSGFHSEKVLKWVGEAHDFQPDLLLLEGTSFSHFGEEALNQLPIEEKTIDLECTTERQLLNKVEHLMMKNQENLIVINLYPQNIQRLLELNELAIKNKRKFVLDKKYYQLVEMHLSKKLSNIFYLNKEEESRFSVSVEEIKRKPNDYLLLIDYERHQILYHLPAGIYLHSNGVPLGPFMAGYESFLTSMIEYGWHFYQAGVSGHACQSDLLMLAYAIQPQAVTPWHTFKPHAFGNELEKIGLNVFYPQYDKKYNIEEILEEKNG